MTRLSKSDSQLDAEAGRRDLPLNALIAPAGKEDGVAS